MAKLLTDPPKPKAVGLRLDPDRHERVVERAKSRRFPSIHSYILALIDADLKRGESKFAATNTTPKSNQKKEGK